ncbi:hypothetical protein D9757_012757 [Collybiopsis confluens]|uniref:Uncharacterized protein n=1 Tax=Collybiopsis confluens TaxID=2823264 RepID=A0A8H5LRC3_9AGAR|nr:hypothetical protein D9757_012757 [Collybiopsis confluens]
MQHKSNSNPSSPTFTPEFSPPNPNIVLQSAYSDTEIEFLRGGIGRRWARESAPSSSRAPSTESRTSTDTALSSVSRHILFSPRSWYQLPPLQNPYAPIPKEQTFTYVNTKTRVEEALDSIAEIARLGIRVVGAIGGQIPVPGLGMIAVLLTNIWDSLDKVGSNRLACLRLAARCADFLIAVKQEVDAMNGTITVELHQPLQRLEFAFKSIRSLMIFLEKRPFWKRWINREDIQTEIERCHDLLSDCLVTFNISLLTRILNQVSVPSPEGGLFSGSEGSDNEPSGILLDTLAGDKVIGLMVFPPSPALSGDDLALINAEEIRDRLRAIQELQNKVDRAADMQDL